MNVSRRVAVAASLGAMLSVQAGAAVAKHLFPLVGADGASLVRIGLGAFVLLLVFRPRPWALSRTQLARIALYGFVLALMNVTFFYALRLVPLGIGVTVEFVGPLGLALVLSRRAVDALWAVLAAVGVALIVPWTGAGEVSLAGVGLAALAGLFWAAYILATAHVTRVARAQDAVSLGMAFSAVLVLLLNACTGGLSSIGREALLPGLGVAVFSSAIPFTLELVALKGLPEKTFSIILSLEPAIAALIGFVALQEVLRPVQLVAMACVIVASVGSTLSARSPSP